MSWMDEYNKAMGRSTPSASANTSSWMQEYRKTMAEYEEEKKKKEEAERLRKKLAEESNVKKESLTNEEEDDSLLDFFQAGALDDIKLGSRFKDGWQFGDITKTAGDTLLGIGKSILGTAGDVGLEVAKGAGGMLEGVADLATYGIAGVADLAGKDAFAAQARKGAQKNQIEAWTKGADDYLEQFSVLGRTSDAVAQGIGQVGTILLTGGLGQAAGLGTAGVTALTTGSMGLSGMGSGMGEAYRSGATDEEAVLYGSIAGAADALSELMFGGLGKAVKATGLSVGLSSADDILAKKVSSMFSSQLMKNLSSFGIKAAAEGFEEVVAGTAQALGKKLTYMSETDFGEILNDENLLEQFVVGAITSGIAQAPSLHIANNTGTDFITGQTENEQAVVQKEIEKRIAEQEADGKKLTAKQKAAIEAQVEKDLGKGYISTDTIEEVLGGETYQRYKSTIDSENALKEKQKALQEEFDTLNKMKQGEMTGEQIDRRADLKEELAKINESVISSENHSAKNLLKERLGKEVSEMVRSDRLIESYNEVERRKKAFEADLNKYDTKQRAVIEKAVQSGILNNTNRTHEFVDMVAKISADKGVLFDFTNNQKLKESGFAIDGKTVNGYVTKDGITINIQSKKSLNSLVGHEITHVLEGTDLYTELQSTLIEYAKTKGDYQGRYDALTKLYEGVEGADINAELTADLVGDYLFTDENFINSLSVNHRNVFQKIYDEVKYLLKVATAGSKEARDLEKVKRAFDKAYKESGKAQGETKYSISEIVDENQKSYGTGVHLDSTLLDNLTPEERVGMVKEYVKELGGESFTAYDPNGNSVEVKIAEAGEKFKNKNGRTVPVNKDLTSKFIDHEVKQEAIALIDELIVTSEFDGSKAPKYPHGKLDNNGQNNWEYWKTYIQDKNNTIWEATLNVANSADGEKILYDISPIKKVGRSVESDTLPTADNVAQNSENVKHSLSDSIGSYLSALSIDDLLKMPDDDFYRLYGDLVEDIDLELDDDILLGYDAVESISDELDADPEVVKILFRRNGLGNSHVDSNRKAVMTQDRINQRIAEHGAGNTDYARRYITRIAPKDFIDMTVYAENMDRSNFDNRVRGDMDSKMGEWDYEKQLHDSAEPPVLVVNKATGQIIGHNGRHRVRALEIAGIESVEIEVELHDEDGYLIKYNAQTIPDMAISSQFDTAIETHISNVIPLNNAHRGEIGKYYGENANADSAVKFSLSDSVGRQLSNEQSEYFKDSVVRDENGNLKVMYHGTSKGGFNMFDTYGSNYGLFGTGSYFTDNKDIAESYTNKGKGNNKQVYETYLNIKNPMDMDAQADPAQWKKAFPDADFPESGTNEQFYRAVEEFYADQWMPKWEVAEEIQAGIESGMGYDGLTHIGGGRVNADSPRHRVYIAFQPEQIKNVDNVNPTDSADIRYSLSEDSDGNRLTQEQVDYFKNSKARDADGRLIPVYHGTFNDFHVFDIGKTSSINDLGQGHYFTSNPNDANANYASLSGGDVQTKIEDEVYAIFIDEMGFSEDDLYDNDHVDDYNRAYEEAEKRFFSNPRVIKAYLNITNPIYVRNDGIYDSAGDKVFDDFESEVKGWGFGYLRDIGYDGIIDYTVAEKFPMQKLSEGTAHFVVFDSNQIKSVANTKPTSDPDIRYSLSEDNAPINKITDSGLTMTYVRVPNQNTQYYGSTYGQNLEPAGEYMSMDTMQGKYKIDGYEYGTIQFKKPLVLEHINTNDTGWKKTVSNMYNGLTGKRLTKALIADGYDAIVTYDDYGYSEIVNLNGKKLNDPGTRVSLSDASQENPAYGNYNVYGSDVALETAPIAENATTEAAPVVVSKNETTTPATVSKEEMVEMFPDGTSPEVELEDLYQQAEALGYRMRETFNEGDTDAFEQASAEYGTVMERIEALEGEIAQNDASRMDSIARSEEPPEMDAPFYGEPETPVMPDDPFEDRDYSDVGKRNVNAYMYENPEVKPFFQMEANAMLGDLGNSIRGERLFNDQVYYDSGGEKGWMGTKRMTTDDIAYLLDSGYTYADIEKGLNAIIEDNGKENNAVSKRIEFALNDRLLKGYTNIYGDQIPPDQDYLKLLREKEITAYSQEAFDAFMVNADQYAPEEIGPVAKDFSAAKNITSAGQQTFLPAGKPRPNIGSDDIAPTYDVTGKKGVPDGQQAFMPDAGVEPKLTRKQLHQNIVDRVKTSFKAKGFDFDNVLKKAKDLSTFATVDNTPQRVMEKALGYKQGQVLSELTVDQVAKNETEGIKWLNSFTDRKNGLLAQISKQYNIKPGSKKSAAAQMYAEGFYVGENDEIIAYGDRELAMDFPNVKVQQQIKGLARDPRIRQIYDETLASINESRARNAYPEIPRLDNYFLHFRAMEDTFSRLGLPFNPNDIRAKDLPTDLNGVTADLKPGQPYFASAMHRTGKRTSFDLLGGLEKYLGSAKNQIYHIDDIQTLRAVRNYIAEMYGQATGLENLSELSDEEAQQRIEDVYGSHLSTFAKFLNEEANVLAGKTALIDRGLEGIIGRRGITFLNTLNRQVGSNMVGYNISSSLTNFLAPVQAFAKSNKFDFVKGMAQTAANKVGSIFGHGDGFAEASPVMIRRKGAEMFYRTPWQKLSDPGYVLMGAVDDISTELIARAKYNELTRKGMDSQQAHYETDKWVSRLMGDRSLGQQPQLYNSKMLGLVTKFQLEVRNQLDSQFYDTIQEAKVSTEDIQNGLLRNAKKAAKITSTFVQLAVLQHLFGKAFESIAGYNPAFDIISAIIKAFGWDDDEDDEDTVLDNIEEGFFELMGDMPYVSTLTGGRIPIESALPIEALYKGEDQYGNEKSRWKTLSEAAPYYLLPGGYGQIKKTMQGLDMFEEDLPTAGSYTDSGNLRFPVEDTTQNRVQAALFGQWASENARDYFDNEWKPLNEKQTQEFIDSDLPIRDYRDYREGLSELSTLAEKADYIDSLDLPISTKNLLINNIADRKEPIDMANYDDFGSFEEFDYAQKNPEKYDFLTEYGISYSQYKSFDDDAKEEIDNAYSWVKNNPEKVTFSKAVTDNVLEYRQYTSALNAIRADKDSSGKSISGSAKAKKVEYINSLDLDYGAKLVLFKSEYNADDTYNGEIIEYIISREDFSYEDKVAILKELGFNVSSDGTVTW